MPFATPSATSFRQSKAKGPSIRIVARISDKRGVDARALIKRNGRDHQNKSTCGVLDQRTRREGEFVDCDADIDSDEYRLGQEKATVRAQHHEVEGGGERPRCSRSGQGYERRRWARLMGDV